MDELNQILRPTWGAEYFIQEGWDQITDEEKSVVKKRVDELFHAGLPFKMKHDKLFYIYTFSLLAQLEVLAIQVPLKFRDKISNPNLVKRLHQQLLDEIFHGLVFTKIVYLLCDPYFNPPPYNESIEALCDFIRHEECPKVALMLLNMIAEGWIEETFESLHQQGVATEVFEIILQDEHRHVGEADLYRAVGLPSPEEIRPKIKFLEDQLLTGIFLQYKYIAATCSLMGVAGSIDFLKSLDKKHHEQLKKINLTPSENWYFFMKVAHELFPRIEQEAQGNHEVLMTPIRKVLMTQWNNPSDPTMVGEFNLNVSYLEFFNKKYPPEAVTILSMQAISHFLLENDRYREFLTHNKVYRSEQAYVGLVVKLPNCQEQLAMIVFENCHLKGFRFLVMRVQYVVRMMTYCYQKREELEKKYPHLVGLADEGLRDFLQDVYGYPLPGSSVVSLSNIGAFGYTQTKSPLRCNESMKFTLLAIERKPVWNEASQQFEPQDILPVSVSADHRLFDGSTPVPKLVDAYLKIAFDKMQGELSSTDSNLKPVLEEDLDFVREYSSKLVKELESRDEVDVKHVEALYKVLYVLQTYWVDHLEFENLLSQELSAELIQHLESVSTVY